MSFQICLDYCGFVPLFALGIFYGLKMIFMGFCFLWDWDLFGMFHLGQVGVELQVLEKL